MTLAGFKLLVNPSTTTYFSIPYTCLALAVLIPDLQPCLLLNPIALSKNGLLITNERKDRAGSIRKQDDEKG